MPDYGQALYTAGGYLTAGADMAAGVASVMSARYQAKLLEYQAEYQDVLTRIEERKIERELRQVIGSQRARTAAAGIMPDVGTPLELQVESEILAEIDIALLRISGGMKKMQMSARADYAKAAGWGEFGKKFGRASATLLETAAQKAEREGTGPYADVMLKGTKSDLYRWSPRKDVKKTKWGGR